jgi:hypothetical protein
VGTTRSCSIPGRAASSSAVVLAPNWSAAPPSTPEQQDASGYASTSGRTSGPSTSCLRLPSDGRGRDPPALAHEIAADPAVGDGSPGG